MISDEARSWLPLLLAGCAVLAGCGDPAWSPTGSMIGARSFHTATALGSGSVLFAGGDDGTSELSSAELYSLQRDTWSPANPMTTARRDHTGTWLATPDGAGQVLIVGGRDLQGALSSAELYDPQKDAWSAIKPMSEGRYDHTATLFPGDPGRVLIVGGGLGSALSGVELYDAAVSAWSKVASLSGPRRRHTATLLPSGKVLIAGGDDGSAALSSVELYDPASQTWSLAESMTAARVGHTATLLHDGRVLIVGGRGAGALSSAEVYDPDATMTPWSAVAPLAGAREGHTATLLENGRVLVTGGDDAEGALSSAELYDVATNAWSDAGALAEVRRGHTATRLADGEVLVAGGDVGDTRSRAERYQPDSQCQTVADCPASLVCNAQGQCASPTEQALENGCAAAGSRPPAGGGALFFGAISLLAALGRRRARGRSLPRDPRSCKELWR